MSLSRATQTPTGSSQSPDNTRYSADDFTIKPSPPIIIRAVVFVVNCVKRLTLNRDKEQPSATLTCMLCCRYVWFEAWLWIGYREWPSSFLIAFWRQLRKGLSLSSYFFARHLACSNFTPAERIVVNTVYGDCHWAGVYIILVWLKSVKNHWHFTSKDTYIYLTDMMVLWDIRAKAKDIVDHLKITG
jgi:hypothetical protein